MEMTRDRLLELMEDWFLRERANLHQLAEKSGVKYSNLYDFHREKTHMLKSSNLQKVLDVIEEPYAGALVQVIGEVGAGAEVYPIDDLPLVSGKGVKEHIQPTDPVETVPAPPGSDGRGLAALRIKGDSWRPYHREGTIIFYERRDIPPSECIGEMVVAKIVDGPTLFKVLKKGSVYGRFNLISPNANEMEDVQIEWCAVVTDIRNKKR